MMVVLGLRIPRSAGALGELAQQGAPLAVALLRARVYGRMVARGGPPSVTEIVSDLEALLPETDRPPEISGRLTLLARAICSELSRLQQSGGVFRLAAAPMVPCRGVLVRLARQRAQEVGAFLAGLAAADEGEPGPLPALLAVEHLREVLALFDVMARVLGAAAEPIPADDLLRASCRMKDLTRLAEREMDHVALSFRIDQPPRRVDPGLPEHLLH